MAQLAETTSKVHKRTIAAMVSFAVNHVPGINIITLEKFLELVYVNGTHGSLSNKQLDDKMQLMIKHIPDTDLPSLLTLADLLNIYVPLTTNFRYEITDSWQAAPYSSSSPTILNLELNQNIS